MFEHLYNNCYINYLLPFILDTYGCNFLVLTIDRWSLNLGVCKYLQCIFITSLFLKVDGHNIVPCWHASPKLEYGARTIRPKIHDQLKQFLTEFPPVIKHPYVAKEETKVRIIIFI